MNHVNLFYGRILNSPSDFQDLVASSDHPNEMHLPLNVIIVSSFSGSFRADSSTTRDRIAWLLVLLKAPGKNCWSYLLLKFALPLAFVEAAAWSIFVHHYNFAFRRHELQRVLAEYSHFCAKYTLSDGLARGTDSYDLDKTIWCKLSTGNPGLFCLLVGIRIGNNISIYSACNLTIFKPVFVFTVLSLEDEGILYVNWL